MTLDIRNGDALGCGHPCPEPSGIGTGFARDADGQTYCYPCAEDREVAAFAAADAYVAYDVPDDRRDGRHGYRITTWTGRELARVTHRRIGRGGFGSRVAYLRAVAPDGSRWYGRHSADWSEAVTLHRSKGNA